MKTAILILLIALAFMSVVLAIMDEIASDNDLKWIQVGLILVWVFIALVSMSVFI